MRVANWLLHMVVRPWAGCEGREIRAAATVLRDLSVDKDRRQVIRVLEGVRVCRKANAKTASEHLAPSLIPDFGTLTNESGIHIGVMWIPQSRYASPRLCTYGASLHCVGM